MTSLTEPQAQALRILHEHGPLRPWEFARLMWPDSRGWQAVHRCGRGASAGAMMSVCGGGYLAKLKDRGWVKKVWRRRWIGDRPYLLGHALTEKGREAAKGVPMLHREYMIAQKLVANETPFPALIMAAMQTAPPGQLRALRHDWPMLYRELIARQKQPGGYLEGELEAMQEGET